jgi:hypothetical protein
MGGRCATRCCEGGVVIPITTLWVEGRCGATHCREDGIEGVLVHVVLTSNTIVDEAVVCRLTSYTAARSLREAALLSCWDGELQLALSKRRRYCVTEICE